MEINLSINFSDEECIEMVSAKVTAIPVPEPGVWIVKKRPSYEGGFSATFKSQKEIDQERARDLERRYRDTEAQKDVVQEAPAI